MLVKPGRCDRIETGGGGSAAASAAVATVALPYGPYGRAPSATAAGSLPMQAVPPYSRPETVRAHGDKLRFDEPTGMA